MNKTIILSIAIDKLHPHPKNPRKDLGDLTELADSIKAVGVLQNLMVVPRLRDMTDDEYRAACAKYKAHPTEDSQRIVNKHTVEDGYTVIIGHRRLAAAKLAGLASVPCMVVEMSEQEQIATMLLENIQRADLTVYEQAQGFQRMLDLGDTIDGIAEKTGFSKTTIRRRIKIAELDESTLKKVSVRPVSLMDYDRLNEIKNIDERNKVLAEIGTNNFEISLRKAKSKQDTDERIAGWREIFDKYGLVEIPYADIWDRKYINAGDHGYIEGKPDETLISEICKDGGKIYFAFGTGTNAVPYLRKDKPIGAATETAEERERRILREKKREQGEKFRELANDTWEMRFDFIKDYSVRDAKANIEKIGQWLCLREILQFMSIGMYGGYMNMMNIKGAFEQLYDIEDNDFSPVQELIEKHPEKAMLYNVYALWGDSDTMTCWDWNYCYKENPKLTALYRSLCALGYEISDEEKQMLNGTHPLYGNTEEEDDESEELDDAATDIEMENDTFDEELRAMLEEAIGK